MEAQNQFRNDSIAVIVSIGTGRTAHIHLNEVDDFSGAASELATNCHHVSERFEKMLGGHSGVFVRLNVDGFETSTMLSDENVNAHSRAYMARGDIVDKLNMLADGLNERRSLVNVSEMSFPKAAGVEAFRTDISYVRTETANSVLNNVIDWLSSGYSLEGELSTLDSSCARESGKWLLESEHIENWISGKHRLMLLKGPPGCGKTFLAFILNKHLRDTLQTIVFTVFIKYSFNMTVHTVLSRLAVQLLCHSRSIPQRLREAYCRKQVTSELLSEFVGTFLKSFQSSTFMVLDALDEFPPSSQEELIQTLVGLSPSLHIFVTSRHFPTRLLAHLSHVTIALEASNGADLANYIQSRVDALSCMDRKPQAKSTLIKHVMEASSELFLLANLHIHELRCCRSPMRAADVAANLPRTPADRYSQSFERLQAKKGHDRLLAVHTLMWIWAAKRSMTLGELSLAVASSTENLTDRLADDAVVDSAVLVDLCDGLVGVRGEQVEFIHFTATEYFNSEGPQLFYDAFPRIGPSCLGFLNASRPLKTIQEWSKKHNRRYNPRWRSDEHRFFYYCALFWGVHAHESSGDVMSGFLYHVENWPCFMLSSCIRMDRDTFSNYDPPQRPIHLAACFGLVDCVRLLLSDDIVRTKNVTTTCSQFLSAGADPRDVAGRSPLSWACERGHLNVVKVLIARNDVEINSQDENGLTPLLWACRNGCSDVVKLLIGQTNVNVNSVDHRGRSVLLIAYEFKHLDAVAILLAHNDVNVNSRNHEGRSPLSLACESGHLKVVQLLLARKNIDVNSLDNWERSPIFYACKEGHLDIMKLLTARKDININSKDVNGRSGLWWAYEKNRVKVMELLLARIDIDVNSRYAGGRSLLSLACENGKEDVVLLLLEHCNIDINSPDANGLSPLSWACRKRRHQVVKLLLTRNEIDINSRATHGGSPLWWACKKKQLKLIELLLSRSNIDVNCADAHGHSLLWWVCKNGHLPVLKLLLGMPPFISQDVNIIASIDHKDVNINRQDTNGRSLLSWASENGGQDVVRLLLSRSDIDVNSRDRDGGSPLSWACHYRNEDVVRLILARNSIDVDTCDSNGRSPLSWASHYGHQAVLRKTLMSILEIGMGDLRCGGRARKSN
ncbi:ankyrin repeat-containing domain protein [Flagelloscypha sp. PMI_526]|nr:ankyrin repeat-containing domain protein [Flagelloscypha sp. PMI_526]